MGCRPPGARGGLKKRARKGEGGVWRVQTVWELSPISKNRKWRGMQQKPQKMGKREKKPSENTQTTRMPPKKLCLSEAPDIALHLFLTLPFCGCCCHLEPDAFVHSVKPRKDVIVLPRYNVSLWYFAKEKERGDVRCHELGMPMNASMWDTFPWDTWPSMSYLLSQQTQWELLLTG